MVSSILGLLSLSAAARGGPVTWEFTGEVTRVLDTNNLFEGQVVIGSPLQGTFTFESSTPDSQPHPSGGVYNDSVVDFIAEVGALSILGPKPSSGNSPNRIIVENSPSGPFESDRFGISIPVTVLGYESLRLNFGAVDYSATVFDNDSLPMIRYPCIRRHSQSKSFGFQWSMLPKRLWSPLTAI